MTLTLIVIASITAGFACVLAAYYLFQRSEDRRGPFILGVLAILFLTVIPVASAVFYATGMRT